MRTYYGTNRRDIFDGGRDAERVYGRDGDDDLYGNGGDDVLFGDGGRDLLVGGDGDDRLNGGAGSDLLAGERGDDVLSGGGGFDYADYSLAVAGAVIDLQAGTATDGDGGRDTLSTIEGVYGSRYDDRIIGNGGTNELFGGAGEDVLIGGGGQDLTVGGAGADAFVFRDGDVAAALGRADLVGDFDRREGDRIDLSGIDANTIAAGDQAFVFVGRAAFSGTAGELRVFGRGGETILAMDVDGDGDANLLIRVDGDQPLAADFTL